LRPFFNHPFIYLEIKYPGVSVHTIFLPDREHVPPEVLFNHYRLIWNPARSLY